jgi:hypothetical protein
MVGSLLQRRGTDADAGVEAAQDTLRDLNIDQVVHAVTAGRESFQLDTWFRRPLTDVEDVRFRQAVFHDLRRADVRLVMDSFAAGLDQVRALLATAAKVHYALVRQRLVLEASLQYFSVLHAVLDGLHEARPRSRALAALERDLAQLATSDPFREREQRSSELVRDLSAVRYNVLIRGAKVSVGPYDDEPDYGEQILDLFDRFRQRDAPQTPTPPKKPLDMNHVEAAVLDRVARLEPEVFSRLAQFAQAQPDVIDQVVARYGKELQFYLAWLGFVAPLEAAGLRTCLPTVSSSDPAEEAHDTFDIALATRLRPEGLPVVNDYVIDGPERVLVVSGPNQGGKTTFARTFGQLHHFAALGCPVAGRSARLLLPDRVLTHFERAESADGRSGKLEEELLRLRAVLDGATGRTVLVLNELFSSTTVADASSLSRRVLHRVFELDALCVYVTFLDELSTLSERTVSMVAGVQPDDPAVRTLAIERRPADGEAYAWAIARKYRLTYDELLQRIPS